MDAASPRSASAEAPVDSCSEVVVALPPEDPTCACGVKAYRADLEAPLFGPVLRVGEVWHMEYSAATGFAKKTLSLHANGFRLDPSPAQKGEEECHTSMSLSPFVLVQACRFHSIKADSALSWMRLFKVSMFQHGLTHFFATCGDQADTERTRWVADISRVIRAITLSLFPYTPLQTDPIQGVPWTATRLLASYALFCSMGAVSLVFCELHAHRDGCSSFVVYADELCSAALLRLTVTMGTVVSERVGVDCSCFSIDSNNFTVRTCALKKMWLRAISNVKVKMRHCFTNPSVEDLRHFRAAILENARRLNQGEESASSTPAAMLPLWKPAEPHRCALCRPCRGPGITTAAVGGAAAGDADAAAGGVVADADAAAGGVVAPEEAHASHAKDLLARGLDREPILSLPSVGSTAQQPSAATPPEVVQQLEAQPSAATPPAVAQQLEAAVALVEPRETLQRDGHGSGNWECRCQSSPMGVSGIQPVRSQPVLPAHRDRLVRIYDDIEDGPINSGSGRPSNSSPWPVPLHGQLPAGAVATGPAPLQHPSAFMPL